MLVRIVKEIFWATQRFLAAKRFYLEMKMVIETHFGRRWKTPKASVKLKFDVTCREAGSLVKYFLTLIIFTEFSRGFGKQQDDQRNRNIQVGAKGSDKSSFPKP
ncbi:hypothetical protein CEXT_696081 [Caerostris extrusa]|uniref:Uncharacterized protein n=1 Tax=Caerostris extrusa TaxID=172846 RepID=A0AAV4NPA3_CAEEX|nr:hypothetical protein CEXT_696081 [Caerostris extrusa]